PATWDPKPRLARMDEYGIHAQILYPNVAIFSANRLLAMHEPQLQLDCVRAYNDFQSDFSSAAPDRFLPMACLPFWDLAETLKELERCAAMGHRGIVFSQD